MPRRPSVIPRYSLCLMIPQDLKDKLDLLLFSQVESRVPHGAYAAFFTSLLTEYFKKLEERQANDDARTTDTV
jgi:hypothetical protein